MKKILLAFTILFLSIGCETKKDTTNKTEVGLELPQYTTLFSVDLLSGKGKFGEVLIPSFSKKMESKDKEKALRNILKAEGWISITAYSTEDAYKANSSQSFSNSHPNALKDGLLGSIDENDKFYE